MAGRGSPFLIFSINNQKKEKSDCKTAIKDRKFLFGLKQTPKPALPGDTEGYKPFKQTFSPQQMTSTGVFQLQSLVLAFCRTGFRTLCSI